MKKILFKGGILVSPRGLKRADVLTAGEKIVAVGRRLSADAQVLDMSGKLIFPGFIDANTHFDLEVGGAVTADNFDTGSASALAGGVTTVVDAAIRSKGETLTDALNNWHMKAFANSSCDYAFHMAISDWNESVRRELPAMFEQGVSSFRVNMIGDGTELPDRQIYELMTALKPYGGIVGCRCENSAIIGVLREEAVRRGETSPASYPKTRPDYAEAEAVNRFLSIARAADAPCIVVPLSTAAGYEEILRARKKGVQVYAETCPQYLLLDDSVYDAPFASSAKFVCSPPLRRPEDNRALWDALKRGAIDTVSTDHRPFTMAQKKAGESDFTQIPNGMPGVETRALLMYTYGVRKKRITLQQMCAYLSENPARLYGMYPKKGAIKAGSDADLVVFDPKASGVITAADSRSACGCSPYEGVKTVGRIERVFLRGKIVYRDGELTQPHIGRFVTRGKSAF